MLADVAEEEEEEVELVATNLVADNKAAERCHNCSLRKVNIHTLELRIAFAVNYIFSILKSL